MTPSHVAEILGDSFPRQVSLTGPEQAATIIPEMRAFVGFLKRAHRLPRADQLLRVL